MKKKWITFGIIILITIVAILIDWPTGPNIKIGNWKKELKVHLGLDLQGGTHLVYELDTSKVADKDKNDATNSVVNVIEKRINALGVSEPVIQAAKLNNKESVIVELPGVQDVSKAINMIGKTAQLSFREIDLSSLTNTDNTIADNVLAGWKETDLNGSHLKKASVQFDQNSGDPYIAIEFNDEGTKLFADITKKNIGNPVAIVLDDQVISAPTVEAEIDGGKAVITGDFTVQEAKDLAQLLNAGALPVPISLVEQRNVGPNLGLTSVQQSMVAGIIGIVLVCIFMTIIYKLPGLASSFALIIYGLIVLALFKLIPVTLSSSGIAGFIISFGMAVDANVLIFARMKEELTHGAPTNKALDDGFKRAFSSIFDSNISTLLTCLILYIFTTGLVRGFAVTLGIGIIVSMFTAIVITRNFLHLFIGTKAEKYLKL